MTAYVVIALKEYLPADFFEKNQLNGKTFATTYNSMIELARAYLEENSDPDDLQYTKILVGYALVLTGSSKAQELVDRIDSLAKVEG